MEQLKLAGDMSLESPLDLVMKEKDALSSWMTATKIKQILCGEYEI